MIVLAFDPSSSCTGYSVHETNGTAEPILIDAGRLTPERQKDPCNLRIRHMLREARKLVIEYRPDEIVIEDTTGKVHKGGRERGMNGAGLAIYGKAVGAFIFGMLGIADGVGTGPGNGRIPIIAWLENDWTGGTRKPTRQAQCVALHPRQYDPKRDPGLDTSDAIMLGRKRALTRDYAPEQIKGLEVLN